MCLAKPLHCVLCRVLAALALTFTALTPSVFQSRLKPDPSDACFAGVSVWVCLEWFYHHTGTIQLYPLLNGCCSIHSCSRICQSLKSVVKKGDGNQSRCTAGRRMQQANLTEIRFPFDCEMLPI